MMQIRQALVPDLVHPNSEGHAALAGCVIAGLQRLDRGRDPMHFSEPMAFANPAGFSLHSGTACVGDADEVVETSDHSRCMHSCMDRKWCSSFSFGGGACELRVSCDRSSHDRMWTSGLKVRPSLKCQQTSYSRTRSPFHAECSWPSRSRRMLINAKTTH